MPDFNRVTLMGNIVDDPKLTYVGETKKPLVTFSLAINHKSKRKGAEVKKSVVFVDITAWGKQGEAIAKYFSRGKPIFIEGRLQYSAWEKDGQKRNKLSVVLEDFRFVDTKEAGRVNRPAGQAEKEEETPF